MQLRECSYISHITYPLEGVPCSTDHPTQVQALMFVTPPLQGVALKRPVAYAVTEFCSAESKAV